MTWPIGDINLLRSFLVTPSSNNDSSKKCKIYKRIAFNGGLDKGSVYISSLLAANIFFEKNES